MLSQFYFIECSYNASCLTVTQVVRYNVLGDLSFLPFSPILELIIPMHVCMITADACMQRNRGFSPSLG